MCQMFEFYQLKLKKLKHSRAFYKCEIKENEYNSRINIKCMGKHANTPDSD